ncbi:MAG TPA: hypothetical protein VF538_15975 [Pyrinomonadaceae bacterium]|jgi:hypothetical protein
MKHAISIVTLLASALLLPACSTQEDFVVLNKSGAAIEVRYTFKRCTPEPPGKDVGVHPPSALSIAKFQKSDHVWAALPKERYNYDSLTCTLTVGVSPDEALLVASAYNYRGHNSEGSEIKFNLENLSIAGSNGTFRLEGRQTQTQFIRIESGDYAITYQ